VESGRTYAREKLNWNRVAEQMVEEYQKILDAQAASAL